MNTRLRLWPFYLSLCLLLSACNWVDSAGEQGVQTVTQVFLGDQLVGGTIDLQEKSSAQITVNQDTTASVEYTFNWSDSALTEGNLAICANTDGFDTELAASSLTDACADFDECGFEFEPVELDDNTADFELNLPALKAPVGVSYALTVLDSNGESDTREYTFCLIAINEAPVANDDTFVIREGIREIISTDQTNLLTNDSDDIDVSNTEYRILPEASVSPRFANFFELNEDGSFTYESSLTNILSDQFDTFEYELSDGVFTSTAKVTLRIVTSNQAPELVDDDIPILEAVEGELFGENLALYFADPENGDLKFSFDENDALPENGTLQLQPNGMWSGIPGVGDAGTYELTLTVSDGGRELSALVTLNIAEEEIINSAPEFVTGTVFNQIILLGRDIYPINPEFTDADDDVLVYSINNDADLPDGVTIDAETGVISGTPSEAVWVRNLRVRATDPEGESAVSGLFYIRVR